MKYRKIPVVVEAETVPAQDAEISEWNEIAKWCGGFIGGNPGAHFISIETPEGTMRAGAGDYVIRGVAGEFYPCKPDIFAATYEADDG